MTESIHIGKENLKLEEVRRVAVGDIRVSLEDTVRKRIDKCRSMVKHLVDGKPYYGINTGFGSLKNVRIPSEKLEELQVNLIRSHACGVGPDLSREVVRAMMFLRAHTLSLGYSGVRFEVVDRLLQMLNDDIVPAIPAQGSVGASGDLAPLAHLALTLMGEGEVYEKGEKRPTLDVFARRKIQRLRPAAKEGVALLNGTQMMTAVGALALLRAENLVRHADIAAAMSMEALLGSPRAYAQEVHQLRPHPGQSQSAENLRKLTADSQIYESHRDCDRVQDAYSLRCAPQVHGAVRDALTFVRSVLEREINSVTDNPLVFPESGDVISAGHFHGQPVSIAMDTMALALTSLGSISERRTYRLLDPKLSELPAGLVKDAGLQSGLMMAQVTAAALVSECKTLAHPASVDSIPTWADQEDHVSMGAFAARKAENVVELNERVIAIEMICAAQGLDLRKPLEPAKGVAAAFSAVREVVPMLTDDRVLSGDFEQMTQALRDGRVLRAVQDIVGELH